MAVIGSYALGLYLVLMLDWSNPVANIVRFGSGIGLGLVCSAVYWVTVAFELSWLRPDNENLYSASNFVFSTFHKVERGSDIWYTNSPGVCDAFASDAINCPVDQTLSR